MGQWIGKVFLEDTYEAGQDPCAEESVLDTLLQIVSEHPEEEYNRIIRERKEWSVMYQLSHIRPNIVEWLPIRKDQTVLEIGSGCGALTAALSDKAKRVTCMEVSKKRSMINATRNQKRDNIEILTGDLRDVEKHLREKYDWITLVDVFADVQDHSDSADPYVDFLKGIKKHLAPGGRIVIAIENRLGLKYFAGCTEDHTGHFFEGIEGYPNPVHVRTFSRPELERLADEAGLPQRSFYYPYPDYKLPMSIYSDEYLPKAGELRENLRNFDRERYLLFDEARAFDSIVKDGLFPVFSNSYLVVLGAEDAAESIKEPAAYVKYSNERAKEFAIRTDIYSEGAEKKVRKLPCYGAGTSHIDNLEKWYEKLEELYRETPLSMNKIQVTAHTAYPEFVAGKTLEEKLDLMLAEKKVSDVVSELLAYVEIVRKAGSREPFKMTEAFRKVFGEAMLPGSLLCAPVTDIDLVAGNAIITEDGYTLMDYEWTFDFPIPVNYVIFRILHFYIYGSPARSALYEQNLYGRAGLTEDEIEQYEKMEKHFQKYVLGDQTPLRFLYPVISPGAMDIRSEECRDQIRTICSHSQTAVIDQTGVQLCVDTIERLDKLMRVKGWVITKELRHPQFVVTDASGKQLDCSRLEYHWRPDVNSGFGAADSDYTAGYTVFFPLQNGTADKKYTITAKGEHGEASYCINLAKLKFKNGRIGRKLWQMKNGAAEVHPLYQSPYEMGLFGESRKMRREDLPYGGWRMVMAQEKKKAGRKKAGLSGANLPVFSIVMPLYNTPLHYLEEMLDSVFGQSYPHFEVCLADGSTRDEVQEFVQKKYGKRPELRYERLKKNGGISENTNAAMRMATGNYIVLADHDDIMEEDALYELASVIAAHPQTDFVYSDEDKVDMESMDYFEPHFKPDFNLYMLRSSNYICHLFAVKRSIAEATGGICKEYDGAQDYDFILKCVERSKEIYHVPKILYHWRCHPDSTAGNPESKMYAWEAGRKALQKHYERLGIDAKAELGTLFGRYRTRFAMNGTPLISILIPNKDHKEDLEKCLRSVYERSTYRNFEVVVIENNSTEEKTFTYYESLPQQYENLRVIRWDGIFDYAAIHNFAVKETKGEYLVFLNNDTEVIEPEWLEEMLGICEQPDVGAVGAKLFFPDGTIQHAGVVVGIGPDKTAGHLFIGMKGEKPGYVARAISMQNMSAVTAACMMTKREIYLAAGGFDETLQVALNDVDFCLRVQEMGKKVVFTPHARLYHYESKSRGLENTPEKKARYEKEMSHFKSKWSSILSQGDPYYNVNLSRTSYECTLRIPE